MNAIDELRNELKQIQTRKKEEFLKGFFKSYEGGYGGDDNFYGITVPVQRTIAKKYKDLNFEELNKLIHSKYHEERLIALFILISQYKNGDKHIKKKIYDFYVANRKGVNNWDLVDSSADKIMGDYLLDKDKLILFTFAKSSNLWDKRIAIIATFQFIKKGETKYTYQISEILLQDTHDLIHKAVGWMLREAGKRVSEKELEHFLKKHYKTMPRTALRYAIEKFPEKRRKEYLRGEV